MPMFQKVSSTQIIQDYLWFSPVEEEMQKFSQENTEYNQRYYTQN